MNNNDFIILALNGLRDIGEFSITDSSEHKGYLTINAGGHKYLIQYFSVENILEAYTSLKGLHIHEWYCKKEEK